MTNPNLGHQFNGWDDVVKAHPEVAEHEDAINILAHGDHVQSELNMESVYDLPFTRRNVPTRAIRNNKSVYRDDPGYSRTQQAMRGYQDARSTTESKVPPVVLVRRAGGYEVADGHHRVSAAKQLMYGTHINAIVAKSPRKDRLRDAGF